ncbi:MAG: bifunctional folylpolyglutamate synthase/dihydrofolate synthase [Kiloniellales bacterium]
MAPTDAQAAPTSYADMPAPERPASEPILARLLHLHPKLIDLSLGRIERLLDALGRPQERLAPVVHVAGTNGKGSLLAFLRAMLEAAGYRVQAYTSPHLVRFNERIRLVDGEIAEPALAALLEECEDANGSRPITFFEITTAAAFLGFSREPADALLLETGLGGRLDATNVIERPACTVLTPISVDHQQFLGRTLKRIAGEKAAIMKAAVPTVVAPQAPVPAAVIDEYSARVAAPLYRAGREWSLAAAASGFRYESPARALDLPAPALPGPHQMVNAACAIACLDRLHGFQVSEAAIRAGLATVRCRARLHRLTRGPLPALLPRDWELWLDGGHNTAAGEALAEAVAPWSDRPLYLVFGMFNTKDPEAFLAPFAGRAKDLRAVAIPGEKNSLDPARCRDAARAVGIPAATAPDVDAAIRDLISTSGDGPARVLICGSLYLAGRVLARNG